MNYSQISIGKVGKIEACVWGAGCYSNNFTGLILRNSPTEKPPSPTISTFDGLNF